MSVWLPLLIAGAAAGAVPASPADELAAEARQLTAPIADVIVYGDRARVVRRGEAALTAGVNVVALPDLPGGTWIDTIRVRAGDAKILRMEAAPVERLRSGIELVEELLETIEEFDDHLASIDAEKSAVEQELSWLSNLTPAPLPGDVEAPRPLAPSTWPTVLDFLDRRRQSARERVRQLTVD
ncbi:MAG: DUF4140 domain-containing protein, partial [Myxococcota bacterium]